MSVCANILKRIGKIPANSLRYYTRARRVGWPHRCGRGHCPPRASSGDTARCPCLPVASGWRSPRCPVPTPSASTHITVTWLVMHVWTTCRCCMVRNQRSDDRYKLLQTIRRCTCFEHMLHMHKSSVEILDDYLQFATFPHFNEKCIDLCVHSTLCSTSVKSTFNGNYSKNWYWLFGCCTHTCRTVNLSTLYDIKTKRVYFMLATHQKRYRTYKHKI